MGALPGPWPPWRDRSGRRALAPLTAGSDHGRPSELGSRRARRARIAVGAIADTSLAARPGTRTVQVGLVNGPVGVTGPTTRPGPRPRGRVSQAAAAGGDTESLLLTGPWPAPLAGLGRTGGTDRPGPDSDSTLAGAASRRAEPLRKDAPGLRPST
jgi:hypothetical protein